MSSLILNNSITSPYIDRRVAEGLFRELLGERPAYRVLNIYGDIGSGKTTFVNKMQSKYLDDSNDIISIKIDFNNRLLHKPQNAVMHIAKELEKKFNFNFMALWKAYAILWHKRYEHSPIMHAAQLPYFDEIKKLLNPKKSKNIVDIAVGIFGDKLTQELERLKKEDTKRVESKLYQFFAADLRRILKDNNYKDCVIALENIDTLGDNYADTPCSKDEWIRDLITHIGKDALFVITSKEPLKWEKCNQSWSNLIKIYEMKNFIKKDSIRYLRLSGVKDKNLQEAIALSSKGEPFWLNLASLSYQDDSNKLPVGKSDIFKHFISKLDRDSKIMLDTLSHSRVFTKDLLEVASIKYNFKLDDKRFNALISMPFVKRLDNQKFTLDKRIKDELIKEQKKEESVEYRSFMFSYYENILQSIDANIVKATPKLVDESIEEAWYHLNLINNEPLVHFEWLDYYIDRFFMYATWEPFLERYNMIVPQLKKAKDKTSKEKLVSLYNNLAGLYESLGDTNISKRYYNMVIKLNRPQLLSA